MTDAYAYARSRVASKISQWNTGAVTLTRTTLAAPAPETPWIPGAPTTSVYNLDARVDGVAADYMKDETILATDLVVIASPKARLAGTEIDLVPRMTDLLAIDGATKVIKKIEAVPASGPAARFHIVIAS